MLALECTKDRPSLGIRWNIECISFILLMKWIFESFNKCLFRHKNVDWIIICIDECIHECFLKYSHSYSNTHADECVRIGILIHRFINYSYSNTFILHLFAPGLTYTPFCVLFWRKWTFSSVHHMSGAYSLGRFTRIWLKIMHLETW